SDDAISVNVDQAKLFKLPNRVATIVVGNPLIADVTLQNGGIIVVTGKGYGATNSSPWTAVARCWSTAPSRWRARATGWSQSTAARIARPIAACRSASAG